MLLTPNVVAWESDVHYGLTRWLALQAGFDVQAADNLAYENEASDSGVVSATHGVPRWTCLFWRDQGGSRLVRDHHFPSTGDVPNPPDKRIVVAGSEAAHRAVMDRIKNPGSNANFELQQFGKGLHALQDSWSHQGEPGVPTLCWKDYAWAHPTKRGGWDSHQADLTQYWLDDTIAAAEATYRVMIEFLKRHPVHGKPSHKPWRSIAPEVRNFASGRTKTEKRKWFLGQGFEDTSFLRGTSIVDGDDSFAAPEWKPYAILKSPGKPDRPQAQDTPTEVARLYQSLFRDWMAKDDFKGTVDSYFSASAATKHLGLDPGQVSDVSAQLAATLEMWRRRDHGYAAALKHKPPPVKRYQFQLGNRRDLLVQYERPAMAFAWPTASKDDPPYTIVRVPPGPRGDRFVAATRFSHAPYDTVLVLSEKIDGAWKVVQIESIVEH